MHQTQQRILKTTEVAALLGVSRTTVIAMADNGALPSWQTIGGHYRFRPEDVERFIAEQRPAEHAS